MRRPSISLRIILAADLSPLHELEDLAQVTLSRTVPVAEIDALKKARPKLRLTIN